MDHHSSYEERILAAALRLAEATDDPNASAEAMSEIVLCARGMLRRRPPEPTDTVELRRRRRTISEVPVAWVEAVTPEPRIEYDDDLPATCEVCGARLDPSAQGHFCKGCEP